MKKRLTLIVLVLFLAGCNLIHGGNYGPTLPTPTPGPTPTLTADETKIPNFDHIIMVMFENQDYADVIGSKDAPTFNQLADENVLMTQYFAVTHPSLPNYIALTGGDTFGIKSDCTTCYVNQLSFPDLIELSGRTWKTYQESMPSPCKLGNSGQYVQKHDPFVYFDNIRLNPVRCNADVVPMTQLDKDLAANQLPNYAFIMPNICNSAHSCGLDVADAWLKQLMVKLQGSPALGENYLIVITFDEAGLDDLSCCGLPPKAGGRVATILISPLAKSGYQDSTPHSHYGLLKTFLIAWNLPALGYTGLSTTQAITAPWK